MSTTLSAGRSKTDRSRLFILAAICFAALVLPLSFTGGAVATPSIGRALGGNAASLTWITNAFMLSFGSLLMAAGALADRFGRKRLFAVGMALFTLTSVALGFAPSVIAIDILRAVQGVAAAAALSSGSAALAQEFDGHDRTRAFSLLGTTFGIGLAFGPVVAGSLIELFSWRAVFFTTAILGAAALAFGLPRMRETRDPDATGVDVAGTATFSGMLGLFTFAMIQGPDSGWGSPLVLSLLFGAAALLAIFIRVELNAKRPMLDLSLFRYARFIGVQMLPIGTCYCYIVLVILLPLRLIGIEGISEMAAGWIMVALSAPMLVVPTVVASLTRMISARTLSTLGFVIAAIGLQWLAMAAQAASVYALIGPMIVIGIGAGMPWGLMDGLAISVVPKERAGMAAGIFNTARVAGEGLTLAMVSALLSALVASQLSTVAPDHVGPALTQLAQRLAAGDIPTGPATALAVPVTAMVLAYQAAFSSLLHVLTAVTLVSAFIVFICLRPQKPAHIAQASKVEK